MPAARAQHASTGEDVATDLAHALKHVEEHNARHQGHPEDHLRPDAKSKVGRVEQALAKFHFGYLY